MFGKHIAYLRKHISNSNCVKQPLLVNKNMENYSCLFLLSLFDDMNSVDKNFSR